MRNPLAPKLRGLFFAFLLLLATAVPVFADDTPNDVGAGLTYDSLDVQVLGINPQVAGDIGAVVIQSRWSSGAVVKEAAGAGTVLVHWPRATDDAARAEDAHVFFQVGERGLSIIGWKIPAEVILPGESYVTATVEIRELAMTMAGFPNLGWGSTDFVVVIGRNSE